MKMILQAIKSMFRKFENALNANVKMLTDRTGNHATQIRELQKGVDYAFEEAYSAQYEADRANENANGRVAVFNCGETNLPLITSNSIAVGETVYASFENETAVYNGITKLPTYNGITELPNVYSMITVTIGAKIHLDVNINSYLNFALARSDNGTMSRTFEGLISLRYDKGSRFGNVYLTTDHIEMYHATVKESVTGQKKYYLFLTRIS